MIYFKNSQMLLQGKLLLPFLYLINVINILKQFSIKVNFFYMPKART